MLENWIKIEWNGTGAAYEEAPEGSIAVARYVSRTGLTGEKKIITPAWTYTSRYRQVWRYLRDAMWHAWRDGAAWYAAPMFKSQHPSEWSADVAASATLITVESLEELLHHAGARGSKPIANWHMFWAWATRPKDHPKAWPLTQVDPEFAERLIAAQTTGHFYDLPQSWGKVFPLSAGPSLYWDGDNEYVLVSKNCPNNVLGSLLAPELADKRQRWEL